MMIKKDRYLIHLPISTRVTSKKVLGYFLLLFCEKGEYSLLQIMPNGGCANCLAVQKKAQVIHN